MKSCLLCKNNNVHPLQCSNCTAYNKFILSGEGYFLIKGITKEGLDILVENLKPHVRETISGLDVVEMEVVLKEIKKIKGE